MSETILTAENLKFRYDSEQPGYALNGVSMQVGRGEFVAVLGANGCGKSTLAKHFNAILLPEEGKVYVEGMDTADDDKLYDIRQTVGMVFQSPDNQIVATVVEEDVAFALENLGVPPEEMRRRVDDAMKMAGIYEFRERAPHNLSGGQKQRVAIAGVVAMRTGFWGSTDNLQMGSFTLKNGMRIHTYGEYDKDGWKVPNPSALPWEKNNFKGAFELKSANGAFGIRIEVQQGRHVPY